YSTQKANEALDYCDDLVEVHSTSEAYPSLQPQNQLCHWLFVIW
uniref:Uncharacterized protein n=1 Tax=Amphimedon queenslandica TaxID=400682 RepID=A0A1X7SWE4_AMPQE